MEISKRFTEKKLKFIKDNLNKENEEQLVYYCMRYFTYTSNILGILVMCIFILAFNYLNNVPWLGVIFGAIAYFLILIIVMNFKRKFFMKNKNEILKYVRERIRSANL